MGKERENFFSVYSQLPYFTKESMSASAERLGIKTRTLDSYIYKGLREGQIIQLKRGCYVTHSFYEDNKTDSSYLFFLANQLLRPSYISLETALQYYGVFAEAVNFTTTSVTTKLPRRFKNRSGLYTYRHIAQPLFTDFQVVKGHFSFLMALPHKAVFDYLYYHTHAFTTDVHPDLLEDLRIDIDEFTSQNKRELLALIAPFTSVKFHL
jgi:predicted transcriptional regulator of viral defense system